MIGLENLFTGISFAGQALHMAGQLSSAQEAEAMGVHLSRLEHHFDPIFMGIATESEEAAALLPLAHNIESLHLALGEGDTEQMRSARDRLVAMLQGDRETQPANLLADPASVLQRVKGYLHPQTPAEHRYRASVLHLSNGGQLPILAGISKVQPIGGQTLPKVLFISLFPPGSNGSGTYTRAMLDFLSHHGAEVGVLFLGHDFDATVNLPQYLVPFTPDEGRPLEGAAHANLPVFDSNPASPKGMRFRNMAAEDLAVYTEGLCDAVKVAVGHFKPDVLVVNHAFVGAEAARRTRLPFVTVCHGTCANLVKAAQNGGGALPENLLDLVLPGMRAANQVIAITDEVAGDIERAYGIPMERIQTISNGFHSNIFTPDKKDRETLLREWNIPIGRLTHVVSFAGRMVDYKGVSTLLEAALIVREKMPGVHFLLAGDGEKREEFAAMAQELGLSDIVHFVGHRSLADLADLHRIADLGVVPSWHEPFGIVPLEIAGTGTPVIASDEGGLRETVQNTVGVRVPKQDPFQLAMAIVTALSQNLKETIGEAASHHVHANYPWEVGGQRLLDLLRAVTQPSRQRGSGATTARRIG